MSRGINKNMKMDVKVGRWLDSVVVESKLLLTKQQRNGCVLVLCNAISGRGCWTTYIRQSQKVEPRRYNKHRISNRTTSFAVDVLTTLGYLQSVVGEAHPNPDKRTPSMFKATEQLLTLFGKDETKKIVSNYISTLETIQLRNDDKQSMDYVENNERRKMRTLVKQLNLLNAEHTFTHNYEVLDNQSIVRVFNHDFDKGGRFYRTDIQAIKQRDNAGVALPTTQTRLGVRIDNKPVIEVDYCCLHPTIICAMYNMDELRLVDYDIYLQCCNDNYVAADRLLFKKAVNIMFNSKSDLSAQGAINDEIHNATTSNNGVNPYSWHNGWSVLKRVYEVLPEFKDFFCREDSFGLTLQNIDSRIMEEIVKRFIDARKPMVPVHDSCLVREGDEPFLVGVMEDAFRKITGNEEILITLKIERWNGTKHVEMR